MAGHSKWANIKHKKAAVDAKRGAAFTKVVKVIVVAVKKGGPDPGMNPSLRLAVEKARSVNMPKDNIERAIKKASGEDGSVTYEELTYEGYAQGGVALLVDALTDNKNRTTPEIRKIFEKGGGNMGEMGCVNWMFNTNGVITMPCMGKTEDELMEVALEAGADDISLDGDVAEITTGPDSMTEVIDALKAQGFDPSGDVAKIAENTVSVNLETAKKILRLMDNIEEHEDVQNVYSSMDLSAEVQEALEKEGF
ncbi:MAG: YebC/PmpR family DNA-binding transcriptional regulator [Planctomycetes bacterium]|nr:YebC/PmpR family DNA-binding transcriptional regulator [Planctomycetota bacterium]